MRSHGLVVEGLEEEKTKKKENVSDELEMKKSLPFFFSVSFQRVVIYLEDFEETNT